MTSQDVPSIDRQQPPSPNTERNNNILNQPFSAKSIFGALVTAVVLVILWGGFHWYDPPSWSVGIPMAMIGGALTLCLPSSAHTRLSPFGAVRFARFAIIGIMRGSIDVSRRCLSPKTLRPGCIPWQTYLPEGRPRRLFAVAITLLPGTLTARVEGGVLTVHALDLSEATHTELAALEARIAALYRIEHKENLP